MTDRTLAPRVFASPVVTEITPPRQHVVPDHAATAYAVEACASTDMREADDWGPGFCD